MSRIVAGARKGRRLQTPAGEATRPTTDRVREALFSALASWAGTAAEPPAEALDGLAFLDLYAGSGAIGLEAASRGAAPVLLVESDDRTAAVARRNVDSLALSARVRTTSVETLARTGTAQSYDVVFADPPYGLDAVRLDAVVGDLVSNGWLARDGLLVLERSSRSVAPRWPGGVVETWDRSYGETVLHFAALHVSSDVAAPDVAAPDVAAPDVAAPDVAAPEVAAPAHPPEDEAVSASGDGPSTVGP